MAKAKILADTISISSDVLTDENIRKANTLSPSVLKLTDLDLDASSTLLYEVALGEENSFTKYGATFSEGKTIGRINDEADEDDVKLELTGILTKIDALEEQMKAFLEDAPDVSDNIEFLG